MKIYRFKYKFYCLNLTNWLTVVICFIHIKIVEAIHLIINSNFTRLKDKYKVIQKKLNSNCLNLIFYNKYEDRASHLDLTVLCI